MKGYGIPIWLVCLLLVGCAKGYVASEDRPVLWNAGRAAIQEFDFQIARADEASGIITATQERVTDQAVTEKLRLTMMFELVGTEYRATVLVRRSGLPLEHPGVDYAIRPQRRREGGTGRSFNEYGTVTTRDTTLEAAILRRMRELLPQAVSSPGPPVP